MGIVLAQLIPVLGEAALNAVVAWHKASAMAAQDTPITPAQWAELDAALQKALDASEVKRAAIIAARNA
jgi:hypothetical protein